MFIPQVLYFNKLCWRKSDCFSVIVVHMIIKILDKGPLLVSLRYSYFKCLLYISVVRLKPIILGVRRRVAQWVVSWCWDQGVQTPLQSACRCVPETLHPKVLLWGLPTVLSM